MLGWVFSSAGPARLAAVAFGAGVLALAAAGPASAGDGSVRPNYTFPAGLKGFQLTTHGGPASPGILVGFNRSRIRPSRASRPEATSTSSQPSARRPRWT